MNSMGIPTIIHYPIPIHQTSIFDTLDIVHSVSRTDETCGKIVSIPIHPFLTQREVDLIISSVNSY